MGACRLACCCAGLCRILHCIVRLDRTIQYSGTPMIDLKSRAYWIPAFAGMTADFGRTLARHCEKRELRSNPVFLLRLERLGRRRSLEPIRIADAGPTSPSP